MSIIAKQELDIRIKRAVEQISKQKIITAFLLFGSYAVGRPTPLSDIDFAVLLDEPIEYDRLFEEKMHLLGTLTEIFQTDNLDLVVLNEAPVGLAYSAMRDGKLLYIRNSETNKFVSFKAKAIDRYFDYRPVQNYFSAALGRRIKEGSYAGGQ